MAIRCFTRAERDGMYVIQPLEGRSKLDCMIVNATVKFVYDRIVDGATFEQLERLFVERALAESAAQASAAGNGAAAGAHAPGDDQSEEERIRFDLYRILVSLGDRDICDYPFEQIVTLLPPGKVLRGTTQVMPMCLLDRASRFLSSAFSNLRPVDASGNGSAPRPSIAVEDARLVYAFPADARVGPAYFEPHKLARRHLDQFDVCFVAVDADGEIEACTTVQGISMQPATLMIFCCAARYDTAEGFEERAAIHLSRLSGLLQVTTLSPKIRFQYVTGGDPPVHFCDGFERLVGELGFRRALVLPDELGPGADVTAYDRPLF